MRNKEEVFINLKKSKFREKFNLDQKDKDYINLKGLDTIKSHAYDFINKRLKPAIILNDGKQTSMRGHPVFKAQHACACCCRDCLYKWHRIDKNRELTNEEVDYIVDFLMTWIERKYGKES
jgi:hypothetical protein